MCRRAARFGRNQKTWLAQKSRRGSPHHKYAQPLLLNAFVCLFGSWTLALKGSTSQFGPGRHLAQALNVSVSGQIWLKSKNSRLAQKSRRGSPHHEYAQPLLLNAFVCLFGSWTLALKGSTSQFGPGRHLAQALNVSARSSEIRSKSKNLPRAKV